MRRAVRAIVIKDSQLLVMHRNKFGQEYDTLPGGNIEVGETMEDALHRELDEETTIKVDSLKLVFIEEAGDPFGTQYIFLANYIEGTPQLQPHSEEAHINKLGQNLYEPKWLPVSELPQTPFVSEKLKYAVVNAIAQGFPEEPVEIR